MDDHARPGAAGPVGDDPVRDGPVRDAPAADEERLAAAAASPPGTGDPRVDAALKLLDRVPELPVAEHAAVFERVHAELTEVLGDLDPESAGTGG
jgi:hypothetical protein